MKILSTDQIRRADKYTIEHEPIASIELMERASWAFARGIMQRFDITYPVAIFVGPGNNGGDGLAVARLLLKEGYQVEVLLINYRPSHASEDSEVNRKRLESIHPLQYISSAKELPKLSERSVIIDALFGSGLSRPFEGLFAETIDHLNTSLGHKIALDIASGLFADQPNGSGPIFRPDLTLTFQAPKLAFFLAENEPYVGDWQVLDIGLHPTFLANESCNNYALELSHMKSWVPQRNKHAHKGTFGKALLLAGSYGKMGAATLSAQGCLRSGAGLLTVHTASCGYHILQTVVPEAMTTTSPHQEWIDSTPDLSPYNAVAIGPGMGTAAATVQVVETILQCAEVPLVIDADGLNILAEHRQLLNLLPPNTILTPHPKEFSRLTGQCTDGWHQLELGRAFASANNIILVLKGAHTTTFLPDGRVYFNTSGNPGMATGGSGDVLTGIILGLLAQKLPPEKAAILGVYLHGLAGDLAAKELGMAAMLASDIIKMMSPAFLFFAES